MAKNLPNYDAVVFDWHGTLLDMDIRAKQNARLAEDYGQIWTPQDIKTNLYGLIGRQFFSRLLNLPADTLDLEDIRRQFLSYDPEFPKKFTPGAAQTLVELGRAGILMGVVTGAPDYMVNAHMSDALNDAGLAKDQTFLFVHTDRENRQKYSGTYPLSQGMDTLRQHGVTDRRRVLFIGDEKPDLATAAQVGIDCRIVASGTKTRQQLLQDGVSGRLILPGVIDVPGFVFAGQN